MTTDSRKAAILQALRAFISQRPGMDPRNYDAAGYRSESREVTRDKHHAETLLRRIELAASISADDILKEASGGGRLTLKDIRATYADGSIYHKFSVDYCTGQYFPVEFRKAVARLAASVLWTWTREHCMPTPCAPDGSFSEGTTREHYPFRNGKGYLILPAGDWLRAYFRREFGKAIAARYFS